MSRVDNTYDEKLIEILFPNNILDQRSEYRACYRPDGVVNKYLSYKYSNHFLLEEINNQYYEDSAHNGELYSDKQITKKLKNFLSLQTLSSTLNEIPSFEFQKFLGKAIYGSSYCD